MYNKFDELNRRTRDFNNKNVSRENQIKGSKTTDYYWNNRNNETYKKNNGMYSKYYF